MRLVVLGVVAVQTVGIGYALSVVIHDRSGFGQRIIVNDVFRQVKTADFSVDRIAGIDTLVILVFRQHINLSVEFAPLCTRDVRVEIFGKRFRFSRCRIVQEKLSVVSVGYLPLFDVQTDIVESITGTEYHQLLAVR